MCTPIQGSCLCFRSESGLWNFFVRTFKGLVLKSNAKALPSRSFHTPPPPHTHIKRCEPKTQVFHFLLKGKPAKPFSVKPATRWQYGPISGRQNRYFQGRLNFCTCDPLLPEKSLHDLQNIKYFLIIHKKFSLILRHTQSYIYYR